jgi:hypothetical protein
MKPTPAQHAALVFFHRREKYGGMHRFVLRDAQPRWDVEQRLRDYKWIDDLSRLTPLGRSLL